MTSYGYLYFKAFWKLLYPWPISECKVFRNVNLFTFWRINIFWVEELDASRWDECLSNSLTGVLWGLNYTVYHRTELVHNKYSINISCCYHWCHHHHQSLAEPSFQSSLPLKLCEFAPLGLRFLVGKMEINANFTGLWWQLHKSIDRKVAFSRSVDY